RVRDLQRPEPVLKVYGFGGSFGSRLPRQCLQGEHCRPRTGGSTVAGELQGKTIAFLATDGVEQIEYTEPRKAVEQAGATAHLVSLESGEIQGFNHLDKGDTFTVDKAVAQASADDYDGLVLPGGVANPDFLRGDAHAVPCVRSCSVA